MDPGGRCRILLIEDNHDIVEVLTELLAAEGYDVSATPSGLDGLVRFAQERPDLVLLDLQVDDLSGLGVGRAIRDLSEAPVVVMSAQVGRHRAELIQAGATACVSKPFDADDLLSLIATLLGRKAGDPAWADQVQALGPEDLERIRAMPREQLDALPFGVIILDRAQRIIGFNSYEQDASGMLPPTIVGKHLREVAPCTDVRECLGAIEDGQRRGHLDRVQRFVFPHRSALTVVSVRLYHDADHDRTFVFVSRRAPGPWLPDAAFMTRR